MKKFVFMFLALAMCLSLSAPAFAAESIDDPNASISLVDYIEYANRELTSLSFLPDVGLSLDELFISQPFEILNDNDDTNYAFFLFQSDHCIGELVVSHYTGSFSSSFLPEEMPLVSSAYTDSTPICLVSTGSSLLMCSDLECEVVVGNLSYSDLPETAAIDEAVSCANMETVSLSSVSPVNEPIPFTTPGASKILSVPHVDNVNISGGICWAAAAASIIAYRDPTWDGLTAMDVYDTVQLNGGDAVGSQKDVTLALKCYGITDYMAMYGSLQSFQVIDQIDADYPIYIAISGYRNYDGTDSYHAVTICGYEYQNSLNDYYVIMDPNVDDKVYISINRSTNAFTYATSYGCTYTDWYRTVYYPILTIEE